jgi:hypothetical protein
MKKKVILSFYADTPTDKNKLFNWRIHSKKTAHVRLQHFVNKGWKIRSAYVATIIDGHRLSHGRIA